MLKKQLEMLTKHFEMLEKPKGVATTEAAAGGAEYYEEYLKQQGLASSSVEPAASELLQSSSLPPAEEEGEEEFDADFVDVPMDTETAAEQQQQQQQQQQAAAAAGSTDEAPADAADNTGEVYVTVGDDKIKLTEVTEAHTDRMTPAEYEDYYDKLRQAGYIDLEE